MNAQLFNDPRVSGVDLMPAAVATQLQSAPLHLAPVGTKSVELDFDGGRLSSDAGVVLLKDIDDQLGLTRALAAVLSDPRDVRRIHFTPEDLLKQRVLQIAAGYEDANDANTLRDQQFPEAVETLSPPCLFANRYAKLKSHPTRLSSFLIGGFDGNGGPQGTQIPLCRCPVRLGPQGLCQPWRPSLGHARHCLV